MLWLYIVVQSLESCDRCSIPIVSEIPHIITTPFLMKVDVNRNHSWFDGKTSIDDVLNRYGNTTDHYTGTRVSKKWKDGGLVGIHLTDEERNEWESVMNVTGDTAAGWNTPDSSLGLIIGRKGDGVVNDIHMAVYFLHLYGRKSWSIGKQYVNEWVSSPKGICSEDLFDKQEYVCTVDAGDLLFIPEGWFHTTCHLDEPTFTLIQWEFN